MSGESRDTKEEVIKAMMQENITKYEKPVKIWKSLILTLFIVFVIATLVLLTTGAYYVLCFLLDGNWR